MRTLSGAVAALVTALLLLAATPSPAVAADAGIEADYVAALNRVRAREGLAPLEVHGELVGVARAWADTMAGANDIWHNPDLGSQVSAPWVVLGENVGTGYEVPVIMQAFVDSPSHHRNIVDPRFDFVGVGVTWGSDGRMYTAHVFMDLGGSSAPAPAPAPATAAPAPPPPPPPPVPAPPPAAAAPERVEAVFAAVRAIGAGGVA
jgi:uncharacterized protein YkwD